MYPLTLNDNLLADGRCVIAISLGNTPLRSPQNVRDILLRLQTQFQDILLLVCDDIHKYEQMIPRSMTLPKAEKLALTIGDEMAASLQSVIQRLEGESVLSANVSVVRWKEIEDPAYVELLNTFHEFRPRFEETLRTTSEYYIRRRLSVATLTDMRVESFTKYTLAELPVQLMGLNCHGEQYTTIFHPVFPQGKAEDIEEGQQPSYVSPIEDVVQGYKNDEEVMGRIGERVPGMKVGSVTRIFFEPLAKA